MSCFNAVLNLVTLNASKLDDLYFYCKQVKKDIMIIDYCSLV